MITDYELCEEISIELLDDYRFALEFMQIDPETSLTKFRRMAELLCILVGNAQNIAYPTSDLAGRIKELSLCQIIDYSQKSALHKLRILGNDGAHTVSARLTDELKDKEAIKEMINAEKKRLEKEAFKAQGVALDLIKDLYQVILKKPLTEQVMMTELLDESWKLDMAKFALSTNYKDKLKAGHIFTRLCMDAAVEDMYQRDFDFDTNIESLGKIAAANYEAACRLSIAEQREKKRPINIETIESENINRYLMEHYCDPECLYFLWSAISECEEFNPAEYPDPEMLLKLAAKNEFPKAMSSYGCSLLQSNQKEAKKWLLKAAAYDDDLALMALFDLERNNVSKEDFLVALDAYMARGLNKNEGPLLYLFKGAELRGGACLSVIGQLCHRVESQHTGQILLEAIKAGSVSAYHYYFNDFKKIKTVKVQKKEAFRAKINQLTEMLYYFADKTEAIKKEVNIGRNDPCVCGSGKKYKKCCLN